MNDSQAQEVAATPILGDADAARALIYCLLGHALAQPPDAGLLGRMARLGGGDTPMGAALSDLAAEASVTSVADARREYDVLFIGVARGELLPYASFYLTGFLHERPLARVRTDMERLGLVRQPGRADPEDHAATLCDIMASLIERQDPEAEAAFFTRHLDRWAPQFFADLERSASARLYRPVGAIGRLMIDLDRQGFAYAAASMERGAA